MAYRQDKLNQYRIALRGGCDTIVLDSITHDAGTDTAACNTSSSHSGKLHAVDEHVPLAAAPSHLKFYCPSCPYCNGTRDATPKHINPDTKPATPREFWQNILVRKYAHLQSRRARANMAVMFSGVRSNEQQDMRNSVALEGSTNLVATKDHTARGDHCSSEPWLQGSIPPSCSDKMFVVAPMVDQSELPFRMLCRQYGATLAYTPMLHARNFVESASYRRTFLTTTPCRVVRERLLEAKSKHSINTDEGNLDQISSREHWSQLKDNDSGGETDDDGDDETEAARLVDRPCIVQFCGHDADLVCRAAELAVEPDDAENDTADGHSRQSESLYRFDAVDLNLGCPQGIARRGRYGSYLMEEWDVIHTLVHTCHVELTVPITVKIRVFDKDSVDKAMEHQGTRSDTDANFTWFNSNNNVDAHSNMDEALTLAYAHMLCDAGAQLIAVHGRTRAMKGQFTGLADVCIMKAVTRAMHARGIAVLTNGNVRDGHDVRAQLHNIGSDGVMVAESLLWDAGLFAQPRWPVYCPRLLNAHPSLCSGSAGDTNAHLLTGNERSSRTEVTTVTNIARKEVEAKAKGTAAGSTVNEMASATRAGLCTQSGAVETSYAKKQENMTPTATERRTEKNNAAAASLVLVNEHISKSSDVLTIPRQTRLRALRLAQAYCSWLRRCPIAEDGMAKAHIFKMAHYTYERVPHMRAVLAGLSTCDEQEKQKNAGFQQHNKSCASNTTQNFVDLLVRHLSSLYAAEAAVIAAGDGDGMPVNLRRCEKETRRAAAAVDVFTSHSRPGNDEAKDNEDAALLLLFS